MSYYLDKSHYEDDGTLNYLVLQPIYRYFKKIGYAEYIAECKSKGLSDESIKQCPTSDNNLDPTLNDIGFKLKVKLDGHCLKQDKVTFVHKKVVKNFIVYRINLWSYMQGANFT